MSSAPSRPRVSLRLKLAALAATMATLPLLVGGLLVVEQQRVTLERLVRAVQLASLADLTHAIESWTANTGDALETVGRVLADDSLDEDARLTLALAVVAGESELDHAAVYAADGALIDTIRETSSQALAMPDRLPEELVRGAAERGLGRSAVQHAEGGRAQVLLAVPIRPHEEDVTGFVAARVPLEALRERLVFIADARFPGIADAIVVLEPTGDVALSASTVPDVRDIELAMNAESSGVLQASDGERYVVTSVPVPATGWVAAARTPARVVFAPVDEAQRTLLLVLAVAVTVALLAALLLARQLTEPLAALVRFARSLARRNWSSRVEVRTNDELSIVANAMNAAAADLEQSEERVRAEEAIRRDLSRFLPAELVDRIATRQHHVELGGTRRQVTVLFADVVGFTQLVERIPPEQAVQILNELFTILTEIVFKHGGMVDKFIGDSLMAVWGAVEAQPDDAARAISCAEDMLGWLETGNIGWKQKYDVEIRLGVGIHTGPAVVGNIGSDVRMEFTAIGDVVNLAARLEGVARAQQILISEETRIAAGEGFFLNDLGEQEVMGRRAPVHVWEVAS